MRKKNINYGYNFGDIQTIPELPVGVIESTINHILTFANKPVDSLVVLDVGSGRGTYTRYLAEKVKRVVGVEPFLPAYQIAVKNNTSKKASYHNCKIENFVTKDRFDLAINLTTIEHMPDGLKSFKRIFRLLKDGGIVYVTAPNKLWPLESHYNLLFLSYLPLPVANYYLKITGKGNSYRECSYSKTYWGMKRFFGQFPCTYKFIVPSPDSKYLGLGIDNLFNRTIKRIGIVLIKRFPIFWAFSKGFIVVATKKSFSKSN
ncbi:hypothetical protein A2115_03115 [Candidatus Woesebacteria bacterium GWA1_41_8]|uniref:Methyltransferase type 11 domain-containing protein n=1 Tax=Candidatus Woesebacteria bacterium GWA1_41_8 TaxID=1802471 RepID=A0A1F7WHX3_9BACT|nr:MAG: hypothetical protein A2115_03115 [Candidatus Woesebacteria bacterium GWA1_41_8]